MAISKLTNTYAAKQRLKAQDMTDTTDKINEVVDQVNTDSESLTELEQEVSELTENEEKTDTITPDFSTYGNDYYDYKHNKCNSQYVWGSQNYELKGISTIVGSMTSRGNIVPYVFFSSDGETPVGFGDYTETSQAISINIQSTDIPSGAKYIAFYSSRYSTLDITITNNYVNRGPIAENAASILALEERADNDEEDISNIFEKAKDFETLVPIPSSNIEEGYFNKGVDGLVDSETLKHLSFDVSSITGTLVVTSLFSSWISLWRGLKDGEVVAIGEKCDDSKKFQSEEVDVTEFDTLQVNISKRGGRADVFRTVEVSQYSSTKEAYSDDNEFLGKIGILFGDSLMQGMAATVGYNCAKYASDYLHCDIVNAALGGTTCADHSTSSGNGSLVQIVNALLGLGTWDNVDTYINNLIGNTEFVYSKDIFDNVLKSIDMKMVSFVIIAHGFNDWQYSVAIDNEDNEEDTTTTCGALRYCIDKILSAYPHIRVYVASPGYSPSVPNMTGDSDVSTNTFNELTLAEFGKKIENCCIKMHIPCWNQYENNGFNKYNISRYLGDGIHKNSLGNEIVGKQLAKFVKSV